MSKIALIVIAAVILGACNRNQVTSPSPGVTIPIVGGAPAAGRIELIASDPPPNATLSTTQCPGEGDFYTCIEDVRLTFSVVYDRNLAHARVWTEFYGANGAMCGGASTDFEEVTAGTPLTLNTFAVNLMDYSTPRQMRCALPVQITRIVARLWDRDDGRRGDLLREQFPLAYTVVASQLEK